MRYPNYSELIFINGVLMADHDLQTGKKYVRDIELLLAAAERPQASAFGADAYPTLYDKAAVLFHAIARNHPFADGNKRTATVGALFLLAINGQAIQWQQQAVLAPLIAIAAGDAAYSTLLPHLQMTQPCDPAPQAATVHDKAIIHTIIREQKWLLDELAKR